MRRAGVGPNLKNLDAFEAWYAKYRRKDAKKKALAAWVKLDPDEALTAKIMAATKAWPWAEDRTKIPLPATWLNGERWNDEVVAVAIAMAVKATPDPHGITPTSLAWWAIAGFDHPDEAANFGCREWNHHEFQDRKRIAGDGAPA